MLIEVYSPTSVPSLMTLAWQMIPGNEKSTAHWLIRDLRARCVLAKYENDPWQFVDARALTGLDRLAAHLPARWGEDNTPDVMDYFDVDYI